MKIGIDGMGGDNAPAEVVKGAVEASKQIEDEIILFGDQDTLLSHLAAYTYNKEQIRVSHAADVISNHDAPVRSVRTKTESSMVKGIQAVKEEEIDVFISAGNTGALMAGGLFILGRIPGIDRPALATVLPSIIGSKPMLLLDSGANSECKPGNLLEFGVMGSIYMNRVLGVSRPQIGLVNIGAEETKGTTVTKAAYELLSKSKIKFIGNVEARDIPTGPCDVLVCDGFVGNVILKLTEGVALSLLKLLKDKFTEGTKAKLAAFLLLDKFKDLKTMLDCSEYGGAPILGVKGALVKMHGSSNANAVKNTILKARPYVENHVVRTIHDEVLSIEDTKLEE